MCVWGGGGQREMEGRREIQIGKEGGTGRQRMWNERDKKGKRQKDKGK